LPYKKQMNDPKQDIRFAVGNQEQQRLQQQLY